MSAAAERPVGQRPGFTLVELLAVIMIIGILASVFLGALHSAEETAKRAKTKALIMKIHNRIIVLWESYQTRKLPIEPTQHPGLVQNTVDLGGDNKFREAVARRKLLATRELMRMEMPDRYGDLEFVPRELVNYTPNGVDPVKPFVREAMLRLIDIRARSRQLSRSRYMEIIRADNESAECLFLTVTLNVEDPSRATELFTQADFGDTDNDGMFEFLDAWGQPVEWLRWAPGYISEYQPEIRVHQSHPAAKLFHSAQPRDPNEQTYFLTRDPGNYPDAFNPFGVDRWEPGHPPPEHGFNFLPLIMSPGPDGEYGVQFGRDTIRSDPRHVDESDPYAQYAARDNQWLQRGAPTSSAHHDNIHNHMTGTKL